MPYKHYFGKTIGDTFNAALTIETEEDIQLFLHQYAMYILENTKDKDSLTYEDAISRAKHNLSYFSRYYDIKDPRIIRLLGYLTNKIIT